LREVGPTSRRQADHPFCWLAEWIMALPRDSEESNEFRPLRNGDMWHFNVSIPNHTKRMHDSQYLFFEKKGYEAR